MKAVTVSTQDFFTADIFSALDSIVREVASAVDAQVSSIYHWQEHQSQLQLVATHGLNNELVGKLFLRPDQGLTGLVAETRRPLSVKHPSTHPRYVFVPRSFEERLESYLGVPVFRPGRVFSGVLTVQRESARLFTPQEISAVVLAANRVASQLG